MTKEEFIQMIMDSNGGKTPEEITPWVEEETNTLWVFIPPNQVYNIWSPDTMFKYMTMDETIQFVIKTLSKKPKKFRLFRR